MGCVGLGNQPERLATSLAAPIEPWMSLMEEAEIWESDSRPDSMPCISEQGASGERTKEFNKIRSFFFYIFMKTQSDKIFLFWSQEC